MGAAVVSLIACGGTKDDPGATSNPPPPKPVVATVDASAGSAASGAPDTKLIERGRYLAGLTGCGVCHTAIGPKGPDFEHAYAGGFEMPEKGGTAITPNITPDPSTGIGNWTDAQVAAAIREGVRPDGKQMYPLMPYMNYNRMTDDDVHALVAFLRTVRPVTRSSKPNKLDMPEVAAPKPSNGPDPVGDPVKHGEYLASLMLCSHCHWTPGAHGEPQLDKLFAGGLKFSLPMLGSGDLFSPNITPDPDTGLGKWTPDQIATTVKTMIRPDGRQIQGPMLYLQGAWSQIEDKDLAAVAAFVHQIPAVKNKVPVSTFKPAPMGGAPADGSGSPGR